MKPWYHGLDPGEHLLLPSDWEECFSHAMRRVAVTINHQRLQCPNLNVGDPYLKARIGEQDAKLFYERIDVPKKPGQLDSDEMLKGEFADWFYGELSPSKAGMYIRVNSRVTWAFLRGTYRSLRYPLYTAAQLGFEGVKAFRSPRAQMAVMGGELSRKEPMAQLRSREVSKNNSQQLSRL